MLCQHLIMAPQRYYFIIIKLYLQTWVRLLRHKAPVHSLLDLNKAYAIIQTWPDLVGLKKWQIKYSNLLIPAY